MLSPVMIGHSMFLDVAIEKDLHVLLFQGCVPRLQDTNAQLNLYASTSNNLIEQTVCGLSIWEATGSCPSRAWDSELSL